MKRTLTVNLETHVVAARPGEWCDHCLLPSAIDVDLALVLADTVTIIGRYSALFCNDCRQTGKLRPR